MVMSPFDQSISRVHYARSAPKKKAAGPAIVSSFPIPHSPFPIPHSSFVIRHSSFVIRHSPSYKLHPSRYSRFKAAVATRLRVIDAPLEFC